MSESKRYRLFLSASLKASSFDVLPRFGIMTFFYPKTKKEYNFESYLARLRILRLSHPIRLLKVIEMLKS